MARSPEGSQPKAPQHQPSKKLIVIGALILLLTYVSKDIVQASLEEKIRRVDLFFLEENLASRLDDMYPNLRDELSRGTDPKRKSADQDSTIFLAGDVPFYFLVNMECDKDEQCQAAEWFRRRQDIARRSGRLENFADITGEASFDSSKSTFELREKSEEEAYGKLTKKGADGNLLEPTSNEVQDYSSAVNSLESALKERRLSLLLNGSEVIETAKRNLRIASVVSGVLYLVGLGFTVFGRLHGPEGISSE